MGSAQDDITSLLTAVNQGQAGAMDALIAAAYADLRATARHILDAQVRPGRPGATLQPTALVNEAFMKLVKEGLVFERRGHFFTAFATCMREVLFDHIRGRNADKRGGGWTRVTFDPQARESDGVADIGDFEAAILKLEKLDARKARLLELRLFSGLTLPEVAEVMGWSRATIERDWTFVLTWLRKELTGGTE